MMHDRGGFAIFYKLILYWELWIRGEKEKRRHHIEPKLIFFFWVKNKQMDGTSLGGPVWLGHHTFTAGGKGSIPGPGRFLMLWGTNTDVPQLLSLFFRACANVQQEQLPQEAHAPQLE